MKFILEIGPESRPDDAELRSAEACLGDFEGGETRPLNPASSSRLRLFLRGVPRQSPIFPFIEEAEGLAVDVPHGQFDLDEISTWLRTEESKAGRSDRTTKLIVFPFPDLASLADRPHGLSGSPRLFSLAHDETRLSDPKQDASEQLTSPQIYARARLVAEAKRISCAAYLKPRWSEDEERNRRLIARAKTEGFDGLIGPARLGKQIKNA